MTLRTVVVMLAVGIGCRDHGAPPALFGVRDNQTLEHFKKTCPDGPEVLDTLFSCHLLQTEYGMSFGTDGRTSSIRMSGMTIEQSQTTFDRVFAPLVSDKVRVAVRSSIAESGGKNYFDAIYSDDKNQIVLRVDIVGGRTSLFWALTDR